jgi:hypothetical protein
MIDSQSNADNNMVNLYNIRLKNSNIDHKINDAHQKLERWRNECHKTIEELYQRKLNEFHSYFNELKTKYEEKKTRVQTNISQLQNQQNIDLIKTAIDSIEQDLNDIEQTSLKIHIRSLNINENYIYMEKEFSLPNLSLDRSKFLYSGASSSAIASNNKVLLMHHYPYLNLIDQDSKIIKQKIWPYDWIRDMSWSKTLHHFILITPNHIYIVNENLEFTSKNVDVNQCWFSCTSSDEFVYLSTCEWGSSIFQLSLSSPFDLIKQWKSPLTCADYEGINDIKYNNKKLALIINDSKEHKKRMELKFTENFSTIWLLQLSVGTNIRLFTCCPINNEEWIVIDGTNSQIYHITKDGKFKTNIHYTSVPYRANLFHSNVLAISAENDLNLYQL